MNFASLKPVIPESRITNQEDSGLSRVSASQHNSSFLAQGQAGAFSAFKQIWQGCGTCGVNTNHAIIEDENPRVVCVICRNSYKLISRK